MSVCTVPLLSAVPHYVVLLCYYVLLLFYVLLCFMCVSQLVPEAPPRLHRASVTPRPWSLGELLVTEPRTEKRGRTKVGPSLGVL